MEYLRRRCVAMSATAEFRIRIIFPRSPTLMVTPKSPASGPAGYNIFTVYGGLDGTKAQASAVLDREAKRLCGGAFVTVKEEEHERLTAWGVKNGQIDYLRQVRCP